MTAFDPPLGLAKKGRIWRLLKKSGISEGRQKSYKTPHKRAKYSEIKEEN